MSRTQCHSIIVLHQINKRMSFAELGSPGAETISTGGRPDPDRLMALLRDYEASGRNPNVDGIPDDMQVLRCSCEQGAGCCAIL